MQQIWQRILFFFLIIGVSILLFLNVQVLNKGGPVIIFVIMCSILSLGIILEKTWFFFNLRLDQNQFLTDILELLKRRQIKEAVERCDQVLHPLAVVLKAAILRLGQSRERIKEAMEGISLYQIPQLEKNMITLITLAHTCVLLGLLGTAVGFAKCFQTIQSHSAGVSMVEFSAGIWQALISTVTGLTVAIPAYLAYNYFTTRINSVILDMERAATELLNFLSERLDSNL